MNIAVQVEEEELYDKYLEEIGCRIFRVTSMNRSKRRFMRDIYHLLKQHPEIEIVHSHQNYSNVYALSVAKMCGIKVRISHSHSTVAATSFARKIVRKLLQTSLPFYASDYWACSHAAAQWLFGRHANSNRCIIVNNAIDVKRYSFDPLSREKLRKKMNLDDQVLWIQVGTLSENKNQRFSINLFKKYHENHPRSTFLLCGDGAIRGQLEELITRLGLTDSVRLLGSVTDVNDLLCACDLFIMPSCYEGLGLSVIEAQASGINCIVSAAISNDILFMNNVVRCATWDEEVWLNVIEHVMSSHENRKKGEYIIRQNGYDVETEATKLVQKYKQLIEAK